jgi:hypothetical protein
VRLGKFLRGNFTFVGARDFALAKRSHFLHPSLAVQSAVAAPFVRAMNLSSYEIWLKMRVNLGRSLVTHRVSANFGFTVGDDSSQSRYVIRKKFTWTSRSRHMKHVC